MKAVLHLIQALGAVSVVALMSYTPAFARPIDIPSTSSGIIANDTIGRGDKKIVTDTVHGLTKKTMTNADSAAVMLPETTVEAKNYLHTAKKSTYTPVKRDKNVSYDATDLLKRMNIPQLVVTPSGSLSAAGGAQVSYFINGVPASADDLKGMNINDVNKVEYLDFPEEANFMGAEHVVNFVMRKYEFGGYTRASLHHQYLNGYLMSENIFSKFAYKRMTYDVMLNSSIRGDNSFGEDIEENYRFPAGTITRNLINRGGKYRSNSTPVKFRTLYSHGTTYISSTIGYQNSNVRRSFAEGIIRYDGFQSPESAYTSDYPLKSNSVTWDGNASFNAGRGWSMGAQGSLYYTHYNYRNSYVLSIPGETDGNPVSDIKNFVNENSIDGKLLFNTNKSLSNRQSINLSAYWVIHNSKMRYLENGNNRSVFDFNHFSIKGGYNLNLPNLYLALTTGLAYEDSRMDGEKVNTLYPFGTVNLRYVFNPKNNMSLWMQYSTFSPNISSMNPTLVQRNEIMYTAGNPELKPFPRFEVTLNYMFQPSNNFNVTPSLWWNHTFNTAHSMFIPMEGKQGMLLTYENSGHTDQLQKSVNCALYLFNRSLVLTARPVYEIQHTSYPGYPTKHPWYIYATATGYFGNFYVSGNFYSGKSAGYTSQNMTTMSNRPHTYWLDLGWGNGKVTANMRFSNIFCNGCDGTRYLTQTPYYSQTAISKLRSNCQRIIINLSYTFGYGKKVNSYDEIGGAVSTSGSSVNL